MLSLDLQALSCLATPQYPSATRTAPLTPRPALRHIEILVTQNLRSFFSPCLHSFLRENTKFMLLNKKAGNTINYITKEHTLREVSTCKELFYRLRHFSGLAGQCARFTILVHKYILDNNYQSSIHNSLIQREDKAWTRFPCLEVEEEQQFKVDLTPKPSLAPCRRTPRPSSDAEESPVSSPFPKYVPDCISGFH